MDVLRELYFIPNNTRAILAHCFWILFASKPIFTHIKANR